MEKETKKHPILNFFAKLTQTILGKVISFVLIVVIIIAAAGTIFNKVSDANKIKPEDVLSEISMTDLSEESSLYTSSFTYTGIASYTKENQATPYYIKYKATIKAGIDINAVTAEVDDTAKVITMTLPEITLNNPDVNPGIEYFKDYQDLSIDDALRCCQEDALAEAEGSDQLFANARENLKSSIEALLTPTTSSKGYTITWTSTEEGSQS